MMFILGCIETFFMFIFYNILFNRDWKKNIILHTIISICYTCLSLKILNITNDYYSLVCIFIVAIIESKILNKEVILSFMEMIMANIILMVLILVIAGLKYTSVGQSIENKYYILIIVICNSMCSVFMNWIMKKTNKDLEIYLIKSKNAWYIIINILCIFFLNNFIIDTLGTSKPIFVFIEGSFIIFIVINIYLYISIYKMLEQKEKLKIKLEYIKVIDELINKFKDNEQEYMNSINKLVSIVDSQGSARLKCKVHNYTDAIIIEDKYSKLKYINDTLIKAIIYNKLQECDINDISFEYNNLNMDVRQSKLTDSELSYVLNSLLNEAIKLSMNSEKRYIELKSKDNDKNSLSLKFSVNQYVNLEYIQKNDKDNLISLSKKIIEKRKGKINFDIKNQYMIVDINI